MTEAEIAWLAGLLEGEGCFSLSWMTNRDGETKYPAFRISFATTDKDIAYRAAELMGVAVLPTVRKTTSGKDVWRVNVGRRQGCVEIARTLFPFMGERRRIKIKEMIEADILHPSREA